MTAAAGLLGLYPDDYRPHSLHSLDRPYPETNCYTDILVEFVHARGDEPLAMMGCALPVDFEGDQWTFFKPRPADVEALYGIDIHEMQPYRPLPEQIAEQIESGRTLIVELDSFYLPDTEVLEDYRRRHVKSSVVAEAIDPGAEVFRYFHGKGLYQLSGEDYRGIFRIGMDLPGDVLPPYTEIARLDAGPRLDGEELRAAAFAMLREQIARRPGDNPFFRFGEQLARDQAGLAAGSEQRRHDYIFPTARMAGSAFEAGADHVEWVLGTAGEAAVASMREIVDGCKSLSFRLALPREFDPGERIEVLAAAWENSFARLEDALG